MKSDNERFAKEVAASLSSTFAESDQTRLVLPMGRRADIVEALTKCLVNRAFCNAYIEALQIEHRARGVGRKIRSLGRDEIPEAEIAARGFAHLSDEELVDIAISPSAVWAIAKVLTDVPPKGVTPLEAGDWFFAALDKEEGKNASTHRDPQAMRLEGGASSAVQDSGQKVSRSLRFAALFSALAASLLLIGFGVGALVFRGGRDDVRTVAHADVSVTLQGPRGPAAVVFDASIRGRKDGFVTTVVPRRGERPRIYPDYGAPETRIGTTGTATVESLVGTPGDPVLMLVTETPATDTVRNILAALPPGTPHETLREKVTEALFASGFRWVGVGTASVPELTKK